MKSFELWISFSYCGREVCSFTAAETSAEEVRETRKLLAYENNCSKDDIKVEVVAR